MKNAARRRPLTGRAWSFADWWCTRAQPETSSRWLAAAALKAGAQVIVTNNLRDFQALPDRLEAQSPDEFLSNLFDLDPEGIIELLGIRQPH